MKISPVNLYSYGTKLQFKRVNAAVSNDIFEGNYGYRINAGIIDDTLSRSAAPSYDDLVSLKDFGVRHIIDFRPIRLTNEREIIDEIQTCHDLGITYHSLPIDSNDKTQPQASQIKEFFDIIDDAKAHNEKVHMHCQAGADRTGFFALLYKQKYGIDTLDNNINEMKLRYGHDCVYYPHLIPNALTYINESLKK